MMIDATMTLQRIAKRTLSDEVYEQLSQEIVRGRMEPGVNLPAERELVERLGVNRGAVREALKRLAHAGLVAISHGGGTKVLDYRRFGGLDLLSSLLIADDSIDLEVARSVMEMRAALAPDIARLCARRIDTAGIERLRGVVSQMEAAADDLERLQTLSLEYWDELVRGGRNIAYELAFNTLRETYERIRGAMVHVLADEVSDLSGYRSICDAVAAHDEAGAAALAMQLVSLGTHDVLELLAALEASNASARSRPGELP